MARPSLLLACVVTAAGIGCGGGSSGDVTGPPGGAGAVDSLFLSLDSADVVLGDTLRVTAAARDAAGNVVSGVPLTYTSSDPAVATVDQDGLVTAVELGEAEIEVAVAGDAGMVASPGALSVAALQRGRSRFRMWSVPRLVITPGEQSLDPGATAQYSVRITNRNDQDLRNRPETRWSSSHPDVAGIDPSGFVVAAKEGETRIIATVTIPGSRDYSANVPLHVVVCGGISRVTEWTAVASANYDATGASQSVNYRISQHSSSEARLVKQPESQGLATWSGPVTGSIQLDNSITFPLPDNGTGVTTEKKGGPIQSGPSAFMELVVYRGTEGACSYRVRYGDFFTWSLENNQGAPPTPVAGPVGTAAAINPTLGARPAAGWVLERTLSLPAHILLTDPPDDDDLPALPTSRYVPGTYLGLQLVAVLGGASGSYGAAAFTYKLTAR